AQLGQDRLPVGGLVRALFARQHVDLRGLERLLDLVGDALAVRGRVVDHRDDLRLVVVGEVLRDRRALLVVAAHHAELRLEALLGQLGVGGRAGDDRDAGLAVDRRGRNRGARVEVADHAGDLRVDQLLRDGGADLGIGLVVFADEHELDGLAADLDALRVRFLDREARAVLVVLAEVGDAAGERADVADLHLGGGGRGRGGLALVRRLLRFFLAAADGGKRHGDQRNCDSDVHWLLRGSSAGAAILTPPSRGNRSSLL